MSTNSESELNKKQDSNFVVSSSKVSNLKFTPPPINIKMCNPLTGEFLGEFKEKQGLLTFEGKTDEAGKVFVDFICATFKQRIEHLYNPSQAL